VAIKQACVAFVLLLSADVLLNVKWVRDFFKLEPVVDQKRTGYVVSIFLLIGCLFWVLDSFLLAFASNGSHPFIASFALDIPGSNLFTRIVFLMSCMAAGMVTSMILRKQKHVEIALRIAKEDAVTREAFLKTLVRTIPDLVWLKTAQGTYLSCNSRFERFFGAKEKEIVGKTDYDFVDREVADAFRTHDTKVIANGKASKNEEDVVFADDGHHEHLETIKTPMYDDSGELIGVLGIGRDITERVNLQNKLVQAQKMESVGRLAGGVAHDFNNMLSIILGNSELLLDDLPKGSPFVHNLKEIKDAAQRSSSLTRQLLAFARKQTISPTVINLNDIVEGILKMLHRLIGEDIDLAWLPGNNLWPVMMDPSQVDQILANLCVNARDSIKDIGKVTIETANVSCDAGYCRKHHGVSPGDYVMMTVSDTGCGMTKKTLNHIFEPFFTTKDSGEGTGLGLATVYGIMKQNHGFVNVYSEPEKGSAFRIYFPRHIGEGAQQFRQPLRGKNPTGRETILLVEDEGAILRVTKKRLEQLGYTVWGFTSPQAAIEKSYRSSRIDLLLTDVVMPEMNGRNLAKKIAQSHPEIKCLFMSGYTANMIAHHGILDEGLNFISKPFSIRDLSITLRAILEERCA
jgi:PAS domain S-box-containing protein